jgi:hypothetical protein
MPKLRTALGLLLGSFVLIFAFSAASPYAASPAKPSGPAIGAIHFDKVDAKQGILEGTYEYNGYTISFRAIRGELNPWVEGYLASAPQHATDALLCDMQHFCFAIQAGGDTFTHEELLAEQHPELLTEERVYGNQLASWALHQDMLRFDDNQYPGLHEQLDSIRGLSDVPFPPHAPPDMSTTTK